MPIQNPKFILADSFSYLNKGDAGIIMGMIAGIEEQFENPRFTIVSETPEIDKKRYPGEIQAMASPFRRVYHEKSMFKKLILFASTFGILFWGLLYRLSGRKLPCPGSLRIVREYSDADAVLISGGDKYYDYQDGLKRAIEGLPKLFETILAIVLGQKLMIFAHSAGPFENKYRRPLLQLICRRADVITSREPISEEYFKSLGANTELTADAAFLAPDGDEAAAIDELKNYGINPSEPIAGLTARKWHFPESDEGMDQYKDGITEVVSYLRQEGYQVVFFPQVIGPNTDDRIVSREIACNMEGIVVMEGDYDVPLLRELIGQSEVFIGTRMHSNIFALSKEVPTAAIAYRHKTNGIMRMFGMEDNVVNIENTQENVVDTTKKVVNNRESLHRQLTERLPEIRKQARQNNKIAHDLVADQPQGYRRRESNK